jgi:hypothetical protein
MKSLDRTKELKDEALRNLHKNEEIKKYIEENRRKMEIDHHIEHHLDHHLDHHHHDLHLHSLPRCY